MSRQGARFDEQTWTAVVLTIVALLAMATAALLGPSLSSNQTPVRLPDISPSMIPLVSGQEPIGQLFVRAGCAVCHRIPGIEGAEGGVGPKLVLRISGPKRLADPESLSENEESSDHGGATHRTGKEPVGRRLLLRSTAACLRT